MVTVLGIAPALGLIVKPVPGPEKMVPILVVNVPLPVTDTLPDAPQATVSADGVTVNAEVVTASPFAP